MRSLERYNGITMRLKGRDGDREDANGQFSYDHDRKILSDGHFVAQLYSDGQ